MGDVGERRQRRERACHTPRARPDRGDTPYGQAVRSVCRRAGFEPRVAHEVTDTATSLAMVGAGLGVAPLTELMLRLRSAGIVAVPLRESVVRHVVVAVGAEARRRPSVAALIDALREGATP
ncbi:LysR substrate-binding domain-containing protein [Streptomyces lydicus]|uniref:LysR substrate-binding domain-containing protein n=1 Tax=Streptomyces lydicus TaxID=47763 RepID=UPI0034254CCC